MLAATGTTAQYCGWKGTGTASRPFTQVVPRRGLRQSRLLATGRDFVEPWIDLTKSVTGGGSTKSPYAELAAKIGKDIYVDVNGWHLYLSDIKAGGDSNLAVALANKLGPEAANLKERDIEEILKKVPISLGGGKAKVSLFDAIPSFAARDLATLIEDFGRR